MIRHTVVFTLKHKAGSEQEADFLTKAQTLKNITTVKNFECLRQVSTKNNFDFGLSMEFDNQEDYDFYSNHPDHDYFVSTRWIKEVEDFMEIDYISLA